MNQSHKKARYLRVIGVLVVAMLVLTLTGSLSAHNLQTKMVSMVFDGDTLAMLDARIDAGRLGSGNPLLQVGDELGMVIKVMPRDGTNTGVGGYVDFYVPNGVTVIDAGYVVPDGSGDYNLIPMKGQSLIAIGDGPIGAKATPELSGLTLGPNINGVTDRCGCCRQRSASRHGRRRLWRHRYFLCHRCGHRLRLFRRLYRDQQQRRHDHAPEQMGWGAAGRLRH